jgi:opacity protein-like surface antigen
MKRILLPLLFLISFVPSSYAQRFLLGIRAGAAITDVSGFDLIDNDNDFKKFGLAAGAFVSTHISQRCTVQMEIDYTQKGSQIPPDTTNNNNYYRIALNYLDASVYIKQQIHINVNKKPNDNIGLEFGASFGTLVGYSFTVQSIDYASQLTPNPTDLSLFVGLDYNITQNFYLCMRYSNSLNSAIPHQNSAGIYGLNYGTYNNGHNLMFQLTLAYVFAPRAKDTGTTSSNSGN